MNLSKKYIYDFKNDCIRNKIYNYLDLLDNNILDDIKHLLLLNQIKNIKIVCYQIFKYSKHPKKYFFNQNNNQLRIIDNLYTSNKKIKNYYMLKMVRLKNVLNLNHILSYNEMNVIETCICGSINCTHNKNKKSQKHNNNLKLLIDQEKFISNLDNKKNQYFYCDICNRYENIRLIKYNSRHSHIKSKYHKICELMNNKHISFNDAKYELNLKY